MIKIFTDHIPEEYVGKCIYLSSNIKEINLNEIQDIAWYKKSREPISVTEFWSGKINVHNFTAQK